MTSIHDNEIISYEIDLRNHKIFIKTIGSTDSKMISIVFHDVLAHLFEHQLEGSIILDISEYELDQFLEGNYELLEKQKDFCWPTYYDTIEELKEKLKKEQYVCYIISASYGLDGWVLAKNLSME